MFDPGEEPARWRRSSVCCPSECVEVIFRNGYALVRDSADAFSPVLRFPAAQWRSFLKGLTGHIDKQKHHTGQAELNSTSTTALVSPDRNPASSPSGG